MNRLTRWIPAGLLLVGAGATYGAAHEQLSPPLRAPLNSTVPGELVGLRGKDVEVPAAQRRVAGMTDYLMRVYRPAEGAAGVGAFSVYVGYYDRQMQGKTIHSPRNCLPGGGWKPLTSSRERIVTAGGVTPVNRYLLQRGKERALVLYWYQGRGRVAANEYRVKWELLRDQALRGRSDEALVRVIVPVTGTEADAFMQAAEVAAALVPAVHRALPG